MSARALLAGALLALSAPRADAGDEGRLRVVWIDVEGGAATLVVAPSGESLLVDAGWAGERDAARIARAAAAEGVERIEHLVVTHFHGDHWGGVADLARLLPVGRYYDRGLPAEGAPGVDPRIKSEHRAAYLAATGGRSTVLRPGERVPLAGVEVEVLCAGGRVAGSPEGAPRASPCRAEPPHELRADDETDNPLSIGLRVRLAEFELLLLGDLTWNVEHALACPADVVGPIDVLQVAHHGFDDASHPALLAAARPAVAVIQNGARKGNEPALFRRLRATPGLADVWQLHRNVATTAADNAPGELVANDAEACEGASLRLVLEPDGASYALEVPSKGTRRTYAVR